MAFASFDDGDDSGDLNEINMIPLIDVMLVLLVIFIVTAPLLTHAVKVDLPKASSAPNLTKPDNVQVGVDAQSRLWWDGAVVSPDEFAALLNSAARRDPQPELHLRADGGTPYAKVAEVMSAAARAGVTKLGFVTEPNP